MWTIETLYNFLNEKRKSYGGLMLGLIIPESMKDLTFNLALGDEPPSNFHLLGWYDKFKFPVYIDADLVDNFYVIGNTKIEKVSANGPGCAGNVSDATST